MNLQWYVLSVKPHKERVVHDYLQSRDITVYFPRIRVKPINPRAAKIRPYFPGYIFVQLDLTDPAHYQLKWVPGSKGLVSFGEEPAAVSPQLIDQLQKKLEEIEAKGGLVLSSLKKGDRVRIISGPFAGYDAIFDATLSGKDRARVLLTFLSHQPQPVKLSVAEIEKISQS